MRSFESNRFESLVTAHLRPLRGQAVILESDLAWFLGLEPAAVLDAVRDRPELFPPDFVFHLSAAELTQLESDSPCLTAAGIPRRKRVAFTTHGVGMLLLTFPDEKLALAAIPVLRAFANYWKAVEAVAAGKRS